MFFAGERHIKLQKLCRDPCLRYSMNTAGLRLIQDTMNKLNETAPLFCKCDKIFNNANWKNILW